MDDDDKKEQRKNKWFFVPKQDIVDNNYDLTINKYKVIEKETVTYRSTAEILDGIVELSKEEEEIYNELIRLLDMEEAR